MKKKINNGWAGFIGSNLIKTIFKKKLTKQLFNEKYLKISVN